MRVLSIALLVVTLTLVPSLGRAVEVDGVTFADEVERGGAALVLHRAAKLRYLIFDVYVAALYLERGARPDALLESDGPRAFDIAYLRAFTADEFRTATTDGIRKNVDAETFAALADEIAAMNALYRDVAPGDRYSVTLLPGVGTELAWNGERLGVVPGDAFGPAYLAIWFGPEPFHEGMKSDLLEPR